jgi:hypothetical protein
VQDEVLEIVLYFIFLDDIRGHLPIMRLLCSCWVAVEHFDSESFRELNPRMLRIVLVFVFAAIANCRAAPVDQLIPWLLDEDRQLRGIPFSDRVEAIVASSAKMN